MNTVENDSHTIKRPPQSFDARCCQSQCDLNKYVPAFKSSLLSKKVQT